jgi:zinc transporter 2
MWWIKVNLFNLIRILVEHTNTEKVLREATKRIHAKYDFFETTLQIEVYEKEMEDCKECTNPE